MKSRYNVIWHIALLIFGTAMPVSSQHEHTLTLSSIKPKAMIAVIFEVMPTDGQKQTYLDIARNLRPELDSIDGFISIERFESIYTPGKILSLSFWRDEEAVRQWRNTEEHRAAQQLGREKVFQDYRLRVVQVIRDYGMLDREEAPIDSKAVHDKQHD